jgi:hypothetical protein
MSRPVYSFTRYFENEVLRKRTYLTKEMCIAAMENAIKIEEQSDGRCRVWARAKDLDNRIIRVVTLADRMTIHNAFPDRNFKE